MDLWCGAGAYWYYPTREQKDEIRRLVRRAADVGVKRLFPYVSQGPTLIRMIDTIGMEIPTEHTYEDYCAAQGWNPLGYLVEVAHEYGMEVHPYIAVHYRGARMPNYHSTVKEYFPYLTIDRFANRHREYWRMTRDGKDSLEKFNYVILSPAFKQARRYEIDEIIKMLKESGADGVQLEFLLGPLDEQGASQFGYEKPALQRFKLHHNIDPLELENHDRLWLKARADYETLFVRELRTSLTNLNRPIHLTATVISQPQMEGYLRVLQNWPEWVSEGLLDGLFLWHRHRDMKRIRTETAEARKIVPKNVELVSELAAWGDDRLNSEELLIEAATISLQSGADGVGVYRMDALDTYKLWPTIENLSRLNLDFNK